MANPPVPPPPMVPVSILATIKKMLGIDVADTGFDTDVVVDINTALMALTQLGVGPEEGFSITDGTQTWTDFLSTAQNVEAAKTYIYLKVKLMFDPPANSTVLASINNQVEEIAFRLLANTEQVPAPPVKPDVDPDIITYFTYYY